MCYVLDICRGIGITVQVVLFEVLVVFVSVCFCSHRLACQFVGTLI